MTESGTHKSAGIRLGSSNLLDNDVLCYDNPEEQEEQRVNSIVNSLSSLDGTHLEEVALGSRWRGKMSAVRRFFCCFVLFDLLLISLTWLICIMIIDSNNIINVLKMQILNYNITSSLFDLVVAAFLRFTILLLFNGVLKLNTTFFIAFTTFSTLVFLVFKVIYYSWSSTGQPTYAVIIILMSFIVAWLEAWFFDCRVLSQEFFALHYVQTTDRLSESLNSILIDRNLRNPIIRNFLRNNNIDSEANESNGNYYSPLESPEESENGSYNGETNPTNNEFLQKGKMALEVAWNILNDSGWKLHKKTFNGDCIYWKNQKHWGKFFLLKAKINANPEALLQELFHNVDKFTSWNKTILKSERIVLIDDHTDVTYQVSSPGGNGVVSSRDFVNVRHWAAKESGFVLAGISVPYAPLPPANYIRGENGPCCWAMKPLNDDNESCAFEFLLNTDLKGWIPQTVVETAITSVLLKYSDSLKEHCQTLSKTKGS